MATGLLYAKDGKLCASQFVELCVPKDYFDNNFAIDQGTTVETFGLLFIRGVDNNVPGPTQLLNIPLVITVNLYDSVPGKISVHGRTIDVTILQYLKNMPIMNQFIVQGKDQAELFVQLVLAGKLPQIINYEKLPDIWWRNLEISNTDFKIPSKIYELILATMYRNPNNDKQRYGELYGTQSIPDKYGYKTGNVRSIVQKLSTFSGFIYEDMNAMISSGINNSLEGIEEPISPLEQIISY